MQDIRYVVARLTIPKIRCDRGCVSRCSCARILDVLLRDDEPNDDKDDKLYDGSNKGL